MKVGLQGEEKYGEQILKHQDTERDPARERVQFPFIVENLDDDHGAADGPGDPEVESIEPSAPERKT